MSFLSQVKNSPWPGKNGERGEWSSDRSTMQSLLVSTFGRSSDVIVNSSLVFPRQIPIRSGPFTVMTQIRKAKVRLWPPYLLSLCLLLLLLVKCARWLLWWWRRLLLLLLLLLEEELLLVLGCCLGLSGQTLGWSGRCLLWGGWSWWLLGLGLW